MNLTATAFGSMTTLPPITRIISVTSKATNYEILRDDTNGGGHTQATIISEPYFDAQTPRNVTGLVGEATIDIQDNFTICCFCFPFDDLCMNSTRGM
jgi:hypothetical protein